MNLLTQRLNDNTYRPYRGVTNQSLKQTTKIELTLVSECWNRWNCVISDYWEARPDSYNEM